MRDLASQSSSGGEPETNSSPTQRSWLSEGTGDIENDMDRRTKEYEGDACQPSSQHGVCCNSSSRLYSKGSCQDANSSTRRYSTCKIERNNPMWKL